MANGVVTNENDFRINFNALRIQAEAHGIDPNTDAMRNFLIHTAEVMAQQHANNRQLTNIMHRQVFGDLLGE